MPKLQIIIDDTLKKQLDQYCSTHKISMSKLTRILFKIFFNNVFKNEKKRLEKKDE